MSQARFPQTDSGLISPMLHCFLSNMNKANPPVLCISRKTPLIPLFLIKVRNRNRSVTPMACIQRVPAGVGLMFYQFQFQPGSLLAVLSGRKARHCLEGKSSRGENVEGLLICNYCLSIEMMHKGQEKRLLFEI